MIKDIKENYLIHFNRSNWLFFEPLKSYMYLDYLLTFKRLKEQPITSIEGNSLIKECIKECIKEFSLMSLLINFDQRMYQRVYQRIFFE